MRDCLLKNYHKNITALGHLHTIFIHHRVVPPLFLFLKRLLMLGQTIEDKIRNYKLLLIALGAGSIGSAVWHLWREPFNSQWITIGIFTIIVSQIAAARIPNAKNAVTVSDTFVFLTVLLFGMNPAIIVAVAASASDSARHAKRWITVATNVAVICLSLFLACLLVNLTFGDWRLLAHRRETFFIYVTGVLLLAAAQGFINTLLLTPVVTLKTGQPLLRTWYENYAWVMVTPISGAVMAGMTSALIHFYGFWAMILTLPQMIASYLAMWPYLKNIETVEQQSLN